MLNLNSKSKRNLIEFKIYSPFLACQMQLGGPSA